MRLLEIHLPFLKVLFLQKTLERKRNEHEVLKPMKSKSSLLKDQLKLEEMQSTDLEVLDLEEVIEVRFLKDWKLRLRIR